MEEDREIPGLVDEIQKYWDHRNTITDQKTKRDKKLKIYQSEVKRLSTALPQG